MKKIALVIFLLSSNALALDCNKAISTPEINACAKQEQEKVEAELNAVYKEVMKSLSEPDTEYEKPSEVKAALIEAQRAWIKFREADCNAVYIQNQGGTIRTVMYISCMQQRAKQRIKELRNFIEAY